MWHRHPQVVAVASAGCGTEGLSFEEAHHGPGLGLEPASSVP